MSYRQVKTPNLDPVIYQGGKILYNWLGWCLAYVQTAFGAGWSGSTAWDGWTNRTQGKHADGNIPTDVYVPIWFDGYWQGGRYGHVAIIYINSKTGAVRIWTSPYTNKPYADVLTSIPEVERIYGMKYVGWSEFVGPTRVIEFVNNNITLPQLTALFRELLERDPDQPAINYYVGKKTYDATRHDIIYSPERNQLLAKKEADRKAADEAARKAQEEADRLAEEERKKKEEQAKEQVGDVEGSDEPFTGEEISLLKRLVQLIVSLINKLTGKEK